jgi:hypothetical protein
MKFIFFFCWGCRIKRLYDKEVMFRQIEDEPTQFSALLSEYLSLVDCNSHLKVSRLKQYIAHITNSIKLA